MTAQELKNKLQQLRNLLAENEIVEFKEAKNGFDFTKLGKYFSALCNEANLTRSKCAWLAFGIENKTHEIVGTNYRTNSTDLENLKKELADKTSNRITFIEIHELKLPEGRVVLFQIPPAPKGLPVAFEGHFYGRDGESLVALNIEELERIRFQDNIDDWTAEIVAGATIEDLDQQAIKKARFEFVKRNPKYKHDEPLWNDAKFLDKAKLTIKGGITRTALILLGKDESEHFLGSFVKIRWNLKTISNQDKSFEVFSIPLILAVDEIYKSIRNLKYVYLRDGTLFPDEFLRYEPFNIREPINNAIAHQDYSKKGYINVVEFEDDHLVFSNYGTFLPGSVEYVVLSDAPEENYRNPFLVAAMKNLDMVETQGGGIRKLFNYQRQRFFPMPEYDFSNGKCKVTITGKILNEDFARILIKNPNLSLEDILLLDKVQKQKPITGEEYKFLKKIKFVEGRRGNIFLAYKVIEPTKDNDLLAEYVSNRSFDDQYFKDLIFEYISKGSKVKRKDIDGLIIPKLSNILTPEKKKNKVTNFLSQLRMDRKIESPSYATWQILNKF
jgi:ATP-dependent DNA helicase RecG